MRLLYLYICPLVNKFREFFGKDEYGKVYKNFTNDTTVHKQKVLSWDASATTAANQEFNQ